MKFWSLKEIKTKNVLNSSQKLELCLTNNCAGPLVDKFNTDTKIADWLAHCKHQIYEVGHILSK